MKQIADRRPQTALPKKNSGPPEKKQEGITKDVNSIEKGK
jgi:hypothetical protein